jgi:phosphotransferase system enzyme I (PtsI)
VAVLQPDRVVGFITEVGGRTSHSAIVARGRGIPAVVNVRGVLQRVKSGDRGAVDGYTGTVEIDPDVETEALYRARGELLAQEGIELGRLRTSPR